MSKTPSIKKRILFTFVLLVGFLSALEFLSFIAISISGYLLSEPIRRTADIFAEQTDRIKLVVNNGSELREVIDPELGWLYRPGYSTQYDRINKQGLRSSREYTLVPAPGVTRLAAFGDSFVYCNEVADDGSWPAIMEEMFPRLEVLNHGVGGYGTDQAYLRYMRDGRKFNPHVVLIGFAPVNMRRNVNVYRRFISTYEWPLSKPRFTLDDNGRPVLLETPLPSLAHYKKLLLDPRSITRIGHNDQWYESAIYENPLHDWSATIRLLTTVWIKLKNRYVDPDRLLTGDIFNRSSSAFKLLTALLDEFVRQVTVEGAVPVIVILPDRESVERSRDGLVKVYDPLVEHLEARRSVYVDLNDAFQDPNSGESVEDLFMGGGHYSPRGNRLAARWLGKWIQANVSQANP